MNGADPAHPSDARNERTPKDSRKQKTCHDGHLTTFELTAPVIRPLTQSESLVIIPWCYQHLISNLKAAADQPGRLLWGNGLFYNLLLWLMRLFSPFHSHLFQVWDSLSAAFSFSPGSHHKSPAVVQLFTIAGNQQNRTLGCYLFLCHLEFCFSFFVSACGATMVHGIIQGSGSLHRSSQTELIQRAISSSFPWAMLVWLQQTERHGPHCSMCEFDQKRPTCKEQKEVTQNVIPALCGEKWRGNPFLSTQIVTSHLPISSRHLPSKLRFCLGAKHTVYRAQIPLC